jgi:hypothetical protein
MNAKAAAKGVFMMTEALNDDGGGHNLLGLAFPSLALAVT